MKKLLLIAAISVSAQAQRPYVQYPDGHTLEVPEGFKAVLIPEEVKSHHIRWERPVWVLNPDTGNCPVGYEPDNAYMNGCRPAGEDAPGLSVGGTVGMGD